LNDKRDDQGDWNALVEVPGGCVNFHLLFLLRHGKSTAEAVGVVWCSVGQVSAIAIIAAMATAKDATAARR
jgi:hypothetical protein